MILNVGSGEDLLPNCVNVDIRPVADVVADCRALPFDDSSATELHAYDVLEHFAATETAMLLAEWHRVLVPHGTLRLRVPNLHALAVQIGYYADKPGPQLTALIQNVYGGHRWDDTSDVHHTGWTPTSLAVALSDAGFTVVDNDACLNMTVTAVKRDHSRPVGAGDQEPSPR